MAYTGYRYQGHPVEKIRHIAAGGLEIEVAEHGRTKAAHSVTPVRLSRGQAREFFRQVPAIPSAQECAERDRP